jgi:hypothetical protein
LKAAQKVVAVPTETLVAFEDVELVALGDAEPVAFGDAELVALGDVELVAFADVGLEPATSLDPEEHPATSATSMNMKESRLIVSTPQMSLFTSPHHNCASGPGAAERTLSIAGLF